MEPTMALPAPSGLPPPSPPSSGRRATLDKSRTIDHFQGLDVASAIAPFDQSSQAISALPTPPLTRDTRFGPSTSRKRPRMLDEEEGDDEEESEGEGVCGEDEDSIMTSHILKLPPMRDSPNNPFLVAPPSTSTASSSTSTPLEAPNSLHSTLARGQKRLRAEAALVKAQQESRMRLKETESKLKRGMMTYVFRGVRVTYAEPFSESESEPDSEEGEGCSMNMVGAGGVQRPRKDRLQPKLLFPPTAKPMGFVPTNNVKPAPASRAGNGPRFIAPPPHAVGGRKEQRDEDEDDEMRYAAPKAEKEGTTKALLARLADWSDEDADGEAHYDDFDDYDAEEDGDFEVEEEGRAPWDAFEEEQEQEIGMQEPSSEVETEVVKRRLERMEDEEYDEEEQVDQVRYVVPPRHQSCTSSSASSSCQNFREPDSDLYLSTMETEPNPFLDDPLGPLPSSTSSLMQAKAKSQAKAKAMQAQRQSSFSNLLEKARSRVANGQGPGGGPSSSSSSSAPGTGFFGGGIRGDSGVGTGVGKGFETNHQQAQARQERHSTSSGLFSMTMTSHERRGHSRSG